MDRPTLTIPVLNRADLLQKCVDSIDLPVRLVIIDNGGVTDDLRLPDDAWVVQPPTNLGVAASWNLAIRMAPHDPYWLIANADTEFAPGDLARLCEAMENGGNWIGVNRDWRVFGISARCVETVGFFDENFHPIYCEDADYEWRCAVAEVPFDFLTGATTHVGSVTYRSDERYAQLNARTYQSNLAYYHEKWGGPHRGGERFTTPFNRGGHIGDWRLRLDRLRDNDWT